jgi:hypothetical protein
MASEVGTMSDGPYRTLPMKPRWKVVAKATYLEAYDANEVKQCIEAAVLTDYRAEVSSRLEADITRVLTGSDQLGLFHDQQIADLDSLQRRSGSPMEASLLGNAKLALIDGHSGAAAMLQAVEDTLAERCLNASRQVEEHMHREASDQRARFVRGRMETAIGQTDLASLARGALRVSKQESRTAVLRQNSIDDGVTL